MRALISREPLAERHRDHELGGTWKGHRDCHVRGEWLLIYHVAKDVITFVRTGTHADLFGQRTLDVFLDGCRGRWSDAVKAG